MYNRAAYKYSGGVNWDNKSAGFFYRNTCYSRKQLEEKGYPKKLILRFEPDYIERWHEPQKGIILRYWYTHENVMAFILARSE